MEIIRSLSLPFDEKLIIAIYQQLKSEMDIGNLAVKTFVEIRQEAEDGYSLVVLLNDTPVGYASVKYWNTCLELMSVYVHPTVRRHGLGQRLVSQQIKIAKKIGPKRRILALCNQNSTPLFQKAGFTQISKKAIPAELRQACHGCSEDALFPDCHCQPHELVLTDP